VHEVANRNHEANKLLGKSNHRRNDNVKVKVKVSPQHTTQVQMGSKGIALLFLNLGAR